MTGEQRLIHVLARPAAPAIDLERAMRDLWHWLSQLQAMMDERLPEAPGLRDESTLAAQLQTLRAVAGTITDERTARWDRLQLAASMAQRFDDKLILLVFGKFNAGKSSLCNFLAERLAIHGWKIRHFQLEHGQVVDTGRELAEGATETTVRVQGVEIGDRLVLLDTPGLHSVTPENAELTLRFTDCADAVLWLSSSTSPGQVQELDELARELQRHKPLLPVITRSDVFDEDEIDGQLCKVLYNKTADNRTLQEQDVEARARTKLRQLGLNARLLRPALSVSVHMARAAGPDDEAGLRAAGFDRLFTALEDLAEPALTYKRRKPAEVLMHHLQEHAQTPIEQQLLVELATLQNALLAEQARVHACPSNVGQAVWRSVMPLLPSWIDAQTRNGQQAQSRRDQVQAVCAQLSQAVVSALQAQLVEQLPSWRPTLILRAPGLESRMGQSLLNAQDLEQADWGEKLYLRLGEILQQHLSDAELGRLIEPCCAAVESLLNACLHLQALLQTHIQELAKLAKTLRRAAPA